MGKVIFHDFADIEAKEREFELWEAKRLAEEFPDLVNVAPEMFDLLNQLREIWAEKGERWEPVEELMEWLNKRAPASCCPPVL